MRDQVSSLLDGYPVLTEMPVRWGDMDAFNHVNNVVYLRYFESARIAYFEELHAVDFSPRGGIGPILAATSCAFKFPLPYPDTISIGARCVELAEDRLTHHYRVVSHRHCRIAAEGEGAPRIPPRERGSPVPQSQGFPDRTSLLVF